MRRKGQPLFCCLCSDSSKGIQIRGRSHFDVIYTFPSQSPYGGSRLFRVGHTDPKPVNWLNGSFTLHPLHVGTRFNHVAGCFDARAHKPTRFNVRAPLRDLVKVTAHITYSGHAIGDEQRQGKRACFRQVDVRIPKSRDEEFFGSAY